MAFVKSETQAVGNQHSSRFASLYVGDLSPDVTEKDLIHKFSSTNHVVSVHLCRNSVTGKSMCYAFINFDSPFSVSNAMACLNDKDLKGKAMRIMWSQRDLSYRPCTGFGNDLYSLITSSCLERMLCPLLSSKAAVEKGHSRGFGFVQFDTEQSAVLGLHVAATKPVYTGLNIAKSILIEILSKICTTPKDARIPKTYDDTDRDTSLVPTHKGFQIQNQRYKANNTNRKSWGPHTLAEELLRQQVFKEKILRHIKFLTFDDEGNITGL